MSFADWKRRSKGVKNLSWMYRDEVLLVAQAAYKAGERQGRKDAEAIALQAAKLRESMKSLART